MAVSLVVAWDTELKEPLEVRRAAHMRHARQIAEEFEQAYPYAPRISIFKEVDFLATEAGMSEKEKQRALEHVKKRSH